MIVTMRDITKFHMEFTDNPIIGKIECDKPSIFDVLKIKGEYYAVGMISADRTQIGVKKIPLNKSLKDKSYMQYITCPYCGFEDYDSFEHHDSEDECECGRCGAVMKMQREVENSYSTQPVKAPNIKPAHYVE